MNIQEEAAKIVRSWDSENALYRSFDAPDYIGDIVRLVNEAVEEAINGAE